MGNAHFRVPSAGLIAYTALLSGPAYPVPSDPTAGEDAVYAPGVAGVAASSCAGESHVNPTDLPSAAPNDAVMAPAGFARAVQVGSAEGS